MQAGQRLGQQRAVEFYPDENDKFEEIVNSFNRKSTGKDNKGSITAERELFSQYDVESLLNHLTDKFSRLLGYMQH